MSELTEAENFDWTQLPLGLRVPADELAQWEVKLINAGLFVFHSALPGHLIVPERYKLIAWSRNSRKEVRMLFLTKENEPNVAASK